MKHTKHLIALVAAAYTLTSCGAGPTEIDVPTGLTPVNLTTGFRSDTWVGGPRVTITEESGAIRFSVEREVLCAMQASAGVRQNSTTIDVFATVGPNPAAQCTAELSGTSTYEGVVPAASVRTFRINVFERVSESKARLIGSGIAKPK